MITIIDGPNMAEFHPVYNRIVFRVDSDLKANDNFRYVAKLWMNGKSTSLDPDLTLKVHPNTSKGGVGEFSVGRLLQDYVSMDFFVQSGGYKECQQSYAYFEIGFGEEYTAYTTGGDAYQVETANNDLEMYTDATYDYVYVWNGAFQPQSLVDKYRYDGYELVNVVTSPNAYEFNQRFKKRFLTGRSKSINVNAGSEHYLYYLVSPWENHTLSAGADISLPSNLKMVVKTYDDANNQLAQMVMNLPIDIGMYAIPCGPLNLNGLSDYYSYDILDLNGDAALDIDILNETAMLVGEGVTKYEVYLAWGSTTDNDQANDGHVYSDVHTFYVKCPEPDRTLTNVHWLNPYGGYDTITMYGTEDDNVVDVNRTQMDRIDPDVPQYYAAGAGADAPGFTSMSASFGGTNNIGVYGFNQKTLRSGYTTLDELRYTQTMFTSPDVRTTKVLSPYLVTDVTRVPDPNLTGAWDYTFFLRQKDVDRQGDAFLESNFCHVDYVTYPLEDELAVKVQRQIVSNNLQSQAFGVPTIEVRIKPGGEGVNNNVWTSGDLDLTAVWSAPGTTKGAKRLKIWPILNYQEPNQSTVGYVNMFQPVIVEDTSHQLPNGKSRRPELQITVRTGRINTQRGTR